MLNQRCPYFEKIMMKGLGDSKRETKIANIYKGIIKAEKMNELGKKIKRENTYGKKDNNSKNDVLVKK